MNTQQIQQLASEISSQCIHHANFDQATLDIQTQLMILQPGEVAAIVGPSRVGKSRATRNAFKDAVRKPDDLTREQPVIWIDNENSQAEGQFSTKAFIREACKTIDHPIYGRQNSMSTEGLARLQSHIARTPESIFRDAFELGLRELKTRYLVIDEAHHVLYAKGGGKAASAILDSWKCLAQKTGVVLVLIGSYALIDAIGKATHLIGRQRRPIEFPRYRSSDPIDILAFDAVLATYSGSLPFARTNTSLRTWNRQLFEGSLGCIGHLSLWIRSALAWMYSHKERHLTWKAFAATAFLRGQFRELSNDIEEGEKKMTSIALTGGLPETRDEFPCQTGCTEDKQRVHSSARATPKPFTRKARRRPRGERS